MYVYSEHQALNTIPTTHVARDGDVSFLTMRPAGHIIADFVKSLRLHSYPQVPYLGLSPPSWHP